MARKKKTTHVGTINGVQSLLSAPMGHQQHITGTGAHKDKRRDKKLRRNRDRQACKEY